MEILKSVLPVVVLLIAGMILREKKLISDKGIDGLQALVMNITLPAGLFAAFYKTTLTLQELILPLTMFVLVSAGIFLARPLCRAFGEKDEYMPFLSSGYEFGMLGYALMTILAGAENITTLAVMDIGQCFAVFTVYVGLLKGMTGEKQNAKQVIKGLITTPVLVAIVAGALIGVTGLGGLTEKLGLSPLIDSICDFASAPTSAAILVVIGYRMNFKGLDVKRVGRACLIRVILQGVFAALVLAIFKAVGGVCAERLTTFTLILAIILPPPFILPLYIEESEKKEFYSLTISAYTVISIAGFAVLTALY